MPDRMPEDMPDRMPEDISDRMPEDLPVTTCINVMVGITRSKVFFLPGGLGEDHNSSFMVPFLVFQVFCGSPPKPSANHNGIPANKIDLGSFQGWSTLSSYLCIYIYIYIFLFFFHFLGLRTPAIYPTGWPYHCTEERARRCYTKAGFKLESRSSASWGKKERSGSEWQRWKKVPTWSMWVPKRQVDQHWE